MHNCSSASVSFDGASLIFSAVKHGLDNGLQVTKTVNCLGKSFEGAPNLKILTNHKGRSYERYSRNSWPKCDCALVFKVLHIFGQVLSDIKFLRSLFVLQKHASFSSRHLLWRTVLHSFDALTHTNLDIHRCTSLRRVLTLWCPHTGCFSSIAPTLTSITFVRRSFHFDNRR